MLVGVLQASLRMGCRLRKKTPAPLPALPGSLLAQPLLRACACYAGSGLRDFVFGISHLCCLGRQALLRPVQR